MSPAEQRLYSNSQVRKAGELLRHRDDHTRDEIEWAEAVLDNFRALHAVPLNTFQATLRKRLEKLKLNNCIVAQRIKRKPTILDKLCSREKGMQLDRMADIGGIRVIVPSMGELRRLTDAYTNPENSRKLSYEIIRVDDYISHPKDSGYRGVHIEFRYSSKRAEKEAYNKLRFEFQIRTELQHAWATAVETFEAFMGEKFKSSQGNQEWLDYFALVSSAFAHMESMPCLDRHRDTSQEELFSELRSRTHKLQVMHMMDGFALVEELSSRFNRKGSYALLLFDATERSGQIRIFHTGQYQNAYSSYVREEERSAGDATRQVVLVKMDTIDHLRKAYPNYFADLKSFRSHLVKALDKCPSRDNKSAWAGRA